MTDSKHGITMSPFFRSQIEPVLNHVEQSEGLSAGTQNARQIQRPIPAVEQNP